MVWAGWRSIGRVYHRARRFGVGFRTTSHGESPGNRFERWRLGLRPSAGHSGRSKRPCCWLVVIEIAHCRTCLVQVGMKETLMLEFQNQEKTPMSSTEDNQPSAKVRHLLLAAAWLCYNLDPEPWADDLL